MDTFPHIANKKQVNSVISKFLFIKEKNSVLSTQKNYATLGTMFIISICWNKQSTFSLNTK